MFSPNPFTLPSILGREAGLENFGQDFGGGYLTVVAHAHAQHRAQKFVKILNVEQALARAVLELREIQNFVQATRH
ncbi:MAG: hypothetical protein U1F83_15915 [Verrucomicrobiota bacterium]